MKLSRKSANPFYALLILFGLAFVVTAAAYGVMATREARAATGQVVADHVLMRWMHDHGNTAILTELALLATCTFAAIGTDDFWQRRANRRQ